MVTDSNTAAAAGRGRSASATSDPGRANNAVSGGSTLDVDHLEKSYYSGNEEVRVVKGVTFRIEPGNFYSLLGPSGCGKTTTLRCVAGLETSDGGTITLGGDVLSRGKAHVSPNERDVGMVFQNYAIWPHMSVFENAVFPLQVSATKVSKADARSRVMESLDMVELAHLADRAATDLSGGQQQRLALARALIKRPKLLLLDEPLSNLDAKLRDTMRAEVSALQRRLGITTLYVTHDQGEALAMSDQVGVMYNGVILQQGEPRDIYDRPEARFVAEFVGHANMMAGTVVRHVSDDEAVVTTCGTDLHTLCPGSVGVGESVTVSVRPESIRIHEAPPDRPNVVDGTVKHIEFLGEMVELDIAVRQPNGPDETVTVRTNPHKSPPPGARVYVEMEQQICRVLPSD